MDIRHLLAIAALACGTTALGHQQPAPDELPATATARLASSLEAARPHTRSVWRDTPPSNSRRHGERGTSRLRAETGASGSSTSKPMHGLSIA